MTYEIGGGSPDLGPWQGEPNTEEARARLGVDRAVPVRPVLALRGFREGVSEGSHRCVVVANESEAPLGVPRVGELASGSDALFLSVPRA
jgi:hypothetical protein